MMIQNWIKALIISLILSVVFTFAQTLLFGGGVKYSLPPEEWDKIYAMPHGEAANTFLSELWKPPIGKDFSFRY